MSSDKKEDSAPASDAPAAPSNDTAAAAAAPAAGASEDAAAPAQSQSGEGGESATPAAGTAVGGGEEAQDTQDGSGDAAGTQPTEEDDAVNDMVASGPKTEDSMEDLIQYLFDAYDIDGDKTLEYKEMYKFAVRLDLQNPFDCQLWETFNVDDDENIQKDQTYEIFRTRIMRIKSQQGFDDEEFSELLRHRCKAVLAERRNMGYKYHYGVRVALQTLFGHFDRNCDKLISPEEWLTAMKHIINALDGNKSWLEPRAFQDIAGGDEQIGYPAFAEYMYTILKDMNADADEVEKILLRTVAAIPKVEQHRIIPVSIMTASNIKQVNKKNEFQHPNQKAKTQDAWTETMVIDLDPKTYSNLRDMKDVIAMKSGLPQEADMTLLYKPDKMKDKICLLTEENYPSWAAHKKNKEERDKHVPTLWVKNVRICPKLLGMTQQTIYVETNEDKDPPITADPQREEMMKKTTGLRQVVLDWEDLVHKKCDIPIKGNVKVATGESLVFEFVASNMNQQYPYRCSAWSFNRGLLPGVVEERLEKVVKKGPAPDFSLRWRFIANGKEVEDEEVIIQIDWEEGEESFELTKAPYCNETCVQFHINVSCLQEIPKAGQYADCFWHGLYWDGVQSKPTKPK